MQFSILKHGGKGYRESVDLRDRILRRPLGLEFTEKQLAAESNSIHVVGKIAGEVVATCLLVDRGEGRFQMRQVAVEGDFQRKGYGLQMIKFIEEQIKSQGGTHVFCHARVTVQAFYDRLGYHTVGEQFEEVTIQHIHMEKQLPIEAHE